MISYRSVMRQRNKKMAEVRAKELSIHSRHKHRGSLYLPRDQRTDLEELRSLQVELWDFDRALIDIMHAKNSKARSTIYDDFADLTAKLSASGPEWRRGSRPIVHEVDSRFSNWRTCRSLPPIKRLRWLRAKHMKVARIDKAAGVPYADSVREARVVNSRLLAYYRCLLRAAPPLPDNLVQRRVREAEERDYQMKKAVRDQRDRSLADDSALPAAPVEQYIK